MNLKEYAQYDGLGLAELVKKGEVTPKELVDLTIEGLNKVNPDLNAVWQVLEDEAYQKIEEGLPKGDFEGVPLLIKEILVHAKGVTSNFGSRFAEGISFPVDSFLMECFRKAGFVLVGTTSTPEWGYNATTEPVVKGATHNPWGLGHSSGGSSGGSAVSVASGIVPVAHGNDGGGSIRVPASQCGVIGLKPTRGRVSAGPFNGEVLAGHGIEFGLTKTIRDTAALLDAVSVPRPGEYSYAPKLEGFSSYKECIKTPVRKLKIAFSTENSAGTQPTQDVVDALHKTVEVLRSLGHEVVEDYPVYDREKFMAVLDIWKVSVAGMVETVANMTGRTPSPELMENAMWQAYLEGSKISAVQYCTSQASLALVSRQISEFFTEYDVLLTPTMPATAIKHGVLNSDKEGQTLEDFNNQMFFEVAPYTALYNNTGQPAITLPLHQSPNGFPIGMQFIGKFGDEATLLQLGAQLEVALPWKDRKPVVHVSNGVE